MCSLFVCFLFICLFVWSFVCLFVCFVLFCFFCFVLCFVSCLRVCFLASFFFVCLLACFLAFLFVLLSLFVCLFVCALVRSFVRFLCLVCCYLLLLVLFCGFLFVVVCSSFLLFILVCWFVVGSCCCLLLCCYCSWERVGKYSSYSTVSNKTSAVVNTLINQAAFYWMGWLETLFPWHVKPFDSAVRVELSFPKRENKTCIHGARSSHFHIFHSNCSQQSESSLQKSQFE